jgi:uncharacterized membrane protein YjfL (UPF0719 family)
MESLLYYWDQNYTSTIFYNFLLLILLFSSLRFFAGFVSKVNFSHEVVKRNNPAFGISIAGISLSLCMILSGVLNIKPTVSIEETIMVTLGYGVIGIFMMAIARVIFDDASLSHISLKRKIAQGNVAAAILDASNVLSTALIIRVIMVWITDTSWESFLILFSAFIISQAILVIYTHIQKLFYRSGTKENFAEQVITHNNSALAISFAGKRVGAAFAIMAASHLLPYELEAAAPQLFLWAVLSVMMIVIMNISAIISERILLFKVNTCYELTEKANVVVALLQAVVYISFGFLISELVV